MVGDQPSTAHAIAGMVIGMATKKVTVTLGIEQVDEIKRRVARGDADSVSGFVQLAVERALDAEAAWDRELDRMLDESGGPLTDEGRAWADAALGLDRAGRSVA
jgi:Arc/MetJ-type ribon-helix-helix transcriptional regulator